MNGRLGWLSEFVIYDLRFEVGGWLGGRECLVDYLLQKNFLFFVEVFFF